MNIKNVTFVDSFYQDYNSLNLTEQQKVEIELTMICSEVHFPPKWLEISKSLIGCYGIIVPCSPLKLGLVARVLNNELVVYRIFRLPDSNDFPADDFSRLLIS